ncbi:hypothetical protein PMIT1342_00292 [Prochlorococcus marinus str. MIT 1342]|uniref:AAA family ATPase n=1 Tax=Prochlorococcus TaxID=1218 RepID=UPI0007B33058|nr:AAA family ATPase [Prochlorococcus marinus]KZR83501.1 hypothetical protein PMIT1342_00292 [Prochlorococcus marinus str. MIT 1342]
MTSPIPNPSPAELKRQLQKDRSNFNKLRGYAEQLLAEKVRPEERSTLLKAVAFDVGLQLGQKEIFAINAEARRRLQGSAGPATQKDEFDIPEQIWAWDQILAAQTPNLLVALQKVGKTALMAGLISAWHYGRGEFLGYQLTGPCPPVLIAGTDQTIADWRAVLAPVGLMEQSDTGKWRLTREGPIKRLWSRSRPVYFDMQGIEEISEACAETPGALLWCDTYAALIAPLGLDEAKPEAAEPLYNLMEMIEPYKTTPALLHHSSKSRANERASNASRNSNAIPAAVSQIISLQWLEPDKKGDQRINLTTEGRNSKPIDLVIEQIDRSQWISHGTGQDIKEAKNLEQVEAKLSARQRNVLQEVRNQWTDHHLESDAPGVFSALSDDEFDHVRKARATLEQLVDKHLIDKRNVNDPRAGGTVIRYRPIGSDLSLARVGIQKHPPQPPQVPEVANASLRFIQSPLSPLLNAKEAEEAEEPQNKAPRARGNTSSLLGLHEDIFWEIVDENPDALPNPIANKFMVATGRILEGRQVRALLQSRPLN